MFSPSSLLGASCYCYSPCHVYTSFLCSSVSMRGYNTFGVRRTPFSTVDRVCKWKHHTLPKCSTSKYWSVKKAVCMAVPRLCCRERENTVMVFAHNVFLLSPLPLPWLSLIQSENGHLTKTRSVGCQQCSIATSRLTQKIHLSYNSTSPAQQWVGHNLKGLSRWANKPAICSSQMAFCCWFGLCYSPQIWFAGSKLKSFLVSSTPYPHTFPFFIYINLLITESVNSHN